MIQSIEIHYSFSMNTLRLLWFILWEYHTCLLFGGGLQLRFAFFLYLIKECVVILKFGSTVSCNLKRDKPYKAQAHCLMYAFTGLHEMYCLQWWPFHLMVPKRWKQFKVLYGTIVIVYHKSSWVTLQILYFTEIEMSKYLDYNCMAMFSILPS